MGGACPPLRHVLRVTARPRADRPGVDPTRRSRLVLREGRHWVELRPRGTRLAEVTDGTLYAPGDLVERPRSVPWDHAALPAAERDTALSPFGLRAVYDSLRREFLVPDEPGPPTLREEPSPSDDEFYGRALSELLRASQILPFLG